MKTRIPHILAHASIVLALFLLTLLVLDYINPSMDFVNNAITKGIIGIACVLSAANAVLLLAAKQRK